jgi:hypothetical protein
VSSVQFQDIGNTSESVQYPDRMIDALERDP